MTEKNENLFEVTTPLDVEIRTTQDYWGYIVSVKHPSMEGKLKEVRQVLDRPAQIRQSRKDDDVYLYYDEEHDDGKRICVVSKHLKTEGYVITAYKLTG